MKLRGVVAVGVAGIAGLSLAACGTPVTHGPVKSGTVTGKEYHPETHYTEWLPTYAIHCTKSGKATTCSQTLTSWIPTPQGDPECWELNFWDGQHGGSICVSHSTWDAAKVGSSLPSSK